MVVKGQLGGGARRRAGRRRGRWTAPTAVVGVGGEIDRVQANAPAVVDDGQGVAIKQVAGDRQPLAGVATRHLVVGNAGPFPDDLQ